MEYWSLRLPKMLLKDCPDCPPFSIGSLYLIKLLLTNLLFKGFARSSLIARALDEVAPRPIRRANCYLTRACRCHEGLFA